MKHHNKKQGEELKKLSEKCNKLEKYCKDLIQANKVLDMENRLAIAQIINMTEPTQLNNLVQAIDYVNNSN